MKTPHRPRILLVDDDDTLRRTLARVLASDFEITQAPNGRVAIEVLRGGAFDAVVTDLEMPELGGDGLAAWIAANQPELAARVLVVTGGAKRADQAAWLRAFDPERVLRKPYLASALADALERVIARGTS